MINAIVAFKKAVADIGFKKAVASIRIGEFLIFRFFFEVLGLSDAQAKDVGKSLSDSQAITDLAAQVSWQTLIRQFRYFGFCGVRAWHSTE